ncbi:hypothetical protein DV735_g2971, partial [Chaetothyriales sp. CBS 134920]
MRKRVRLVNVAMRKSEDGIAVAHEAVGCPGPRRLGKLGRRVPEDRTYQTWRLVKNPAPLASAHGSHAQRLSNAILLLDSNSEQAESLQYARRPRRRTRVEKYEYRGDEQEKRARKKPGPMSRNWKNKSGDALNRDFKAPNVESKRLTLNSRTIPGFLAKGRASAPMPRRGLTFSELAFLSMGPELDGTEGRSKRVASSASNNQDSLRSDDVAPTRSTLPQFQAYNPASSPGSCLCRAPLTNQVDKDTQYRAPLAKQVDKDNQYQAPLTKQVDKDTQHWGPHAHRLGKYYSLEDLKELAASGSRSEKSKHHLPPPVDLTLPFIGRSPDGRNHESSCDDQWGYEANAYGAVPVFDLARAQAVDYDRRVAADEQVSDPHGKHNLTDSGPALLSGLSTPWPDQQPYPSIDIPDLSTRLSGDDNQPYAAEYMTFEVPDFDLYGLMIDGKKPTHKALQYSKDRHNSAANLSPRRNKEPQQERRRDYLATGGGGGDDYTQPGSSSISPDMASTIDSEGRRGRDNNSSPLSPAILPRIKKVQYGYDNIWQSYEVYLPDEAARGEQDTGVKPQYWVVYIHGGYFRDPKIKQVQAHVAGYASINYRLAPHERYPEGEDDDDDNNNVLAYERRKAQWPQMLDDVLAALRHLQTRYGFGEHYLLVGHSVGATLALLAALKAHGDHQAPSTPAPLAVAGVCGIYDFEALHGKFPDYAYLTRNAIPHETDWVKASPARYSRDGYDELWARGRRRWLLLAQSRTDGLVDFEQAEEMNKVVEDDSLILSDLIEITGKHDEIWKQGHELARVVAMGVAEMMSLNQ